MISNTHSEDTFHAGSTENSVLLPSCVGLCFNEIRVNSKLQLPAPLHPRQSPGILTFEDWVVQIPVPTGHDSVQRPCPIVGFVCQIPLLKNRTWPFMWWCLLQKQNFNIETMKNDLRWNKLPSRTMLISKCKLLETRQRLSNEGTTEPRAFMVVCILNCSE